MKLQDPFLILPKIGTYVRTYKDKGGDKNKNKKLMSLSIDDNKLYEKCKGILTNFEDLRNIELNALPTYDHRYIKTKLL